MSFLGPGYHRQTKTSTLLAACKSCGVRSELVSYDAWRTFDILFLPVLPLGRVRVIDACPRCGFAEHLGQAQWQRLRDAAKGKAVDFFRSGLSREEMEELLQLVRKFDLRQSYDAMVTLAEQRAGESGESWRLLADVARHFGDFERAERALERCRELGLGARSAAPAAARLPPVPAALPASGSAAPVLPAPALAPPRRLFTTLFRVGMVGCAGGLAFLVVILAIAGKRSTSLPEPPVADPGPTAVAAGEGSSSLAPSPASPPAEERPQTTPPGEWAAYLLDTYGREAAAAWVKNYVATENLPEALKLALFEQVLSKAEFAEIARDALALRPVAMAWHRSYQNVAQREDGGNAAVLAEYQAHLAKDQRDSGLHYLTARLLAGEAARELLREGLRRKPVSPWVHHALAWHNLTAGKFLEAADHSRQARQLDPRERAFQYVQNESWIALRKFHEAVGNGLEGDISEQLAVFALIWKKDELDQTISSLLQRMPPAQRPELEGLFRSELCAPQGLACYEDRLARVDSAAARIRVAMIERDQETAQRLVGTSQDARALLLMALVFAEQEGGANWRAKAAASLRSNGTLESRVAAAALTGAAFDRQELLESTLEPRLKSLVLAIVGKASQDQPMIELAARLNYHPGYFQHLVARELG